MTRPFDRPACAGSAADPVRTITVDGDVLTQLRTIIALSRANRGDVFVVTVAQGRRVQAQRPAG